MTQELSPAQWTPQQFKTLKRQVRDESGRFWARVRKELLPDLANLQDDSCAQLRRRFPIFFVDPALKGDPVIIKFRDQLREVWRAATERSMRARLILHDWVRWCSLNHRPTWTVPSWADGTYTVEPNYMVFPLALATAAGEWMAKMAVCANPACPAPYFLKTRRTRRFCELPACIAAGQRQHKLEWWRRVGAKQRASRGKSALNRNQRERSKR
jgi:hypothetical protein